MNSKVDNTKLYRLSLDNIESLVKIQDYYFNELKLTPPHVPDLVRAMIDLGVKKFWEGEEKRSKATKKGAK